MRRTSRAPSCVLTAAAPCQRECPWRAHLDLGRPIRLAAKTSSRGARLRVAPWILALLAAIGGCAHVAPPAPDAFSPTRDPLAFTQQEVDLLLQQSSLTDAQRDVVRRAGETGFVTFDDYQQAIYANLDCLREAGLNPRDIETTSNSGQPIVTYVIGSNAALSDDANQAAIDSCARAHSAAVEQLYSRNPGAAQRAIEVQDAMFAGAVTDCLMAGGYSVADQEGRTWRDVAGEVLYNQTDNATLLCILDTGVAESGLILPIPEG